MNNADNMHDAADEARDAGRSSRDPSMSMTRMAYMADLLLELRDMASAEGHTTLAGILALAHSEAITKTR